ncbi:MAG TPA: hypothetical protein VJP85_02385 [Candidatus Baltobacteraceae bacterium]|nr:hypothetical protein [Candidatus Baltobacteraceae bacterium]
MPVILTQHYSSANRIYDDVEYALYHYPRQYFSRISAYDRFIYYRPLGKSAPRLDSKTYFGHGILGQWWEDPLRPDHRYVPLRQAQEFPHLVPIYARSGEYYETESNSPPSFQSAVREISETAYWKILAAGDVKSRDLSAVPDTELVAAQGYAPLTFLPRDSLREISAIPGGAGYKPHGDNRPNVYESAALQERARNDHQAVLRLIQERVFQHGGATWYNNNIDLYARIDECRMLIEAKSLVDLRAAVDRMRYGIGQLADYDFRYRDELGHPQKVLAFGAQPDRQTTWIGSVLDDQQIAFVANAGGRLIPMNQRAESLPLF